MGEYVNLIDLFHLSAIWGV